MTKYLGDFAAGVAVRGTFQTRAKATGAPITLAGSPTLAVYKDGGTTEATTGVALTVDFDSRTGHHLYAITTSDAFYATGSDYRIVLTAGTVDGESVVGVEVGSFSIMNRSAQTAAAAAITAAELPTAALVSGEIASDVEQGLNGWGAASAILVTGLATSTNVTDARDSILNRIGAFAGTGANTILGFLLAIMSKTATKPSEVGGAYDPATDSQEAIREAVGDIEGGLTGDYTLTVTVTDADDSAPIENATVTLSRTGERGAELTNASGVAVVGLNAATWSWIVRAAGYESRTGTVVVSGDQALSVALDGIVVATPTDPNAATLRVTCIGEDSLIDPDAVVRIRMIEAPASQVGFGYIGVEATFAANSNGIAERLVIRGATYEIRREGTYKQWQKFVMPVDEDLILIDSFVQP